MATDKATNSRLLKTYGITLEEFNNRFEAQGGICKICKKPHASERRFHIDHDHKYKYVKIDTKKTDGWMSKAIYCGKTFMEVGATKSEAIQKVRSKLKVASIRGLICWPCNRSLRSFGDNPDAMESAAKYLREFNNEPRG